MTIKRYDAFDLSGEEPEITDDEAELSHEYRLQKARNHAIRYFKVRANIPTEILAEAIRQQYRPANGLEDEKVLMWFYRFKQK